MRLLLTVLFVGTVIGILVWAGLALQHEGARMRAAEESCYPYRVGATYSDLGKFMVLCADGEVREVERMND